MKRGSIMLIEDNEKLNMVNTRALESEGYQVQTATTLRAARELLSKTDPEVIILDIMLPDGDGLVFCDEIRSQTKAHIIFLTAMREHETLLQGFSLGGGDFIKKPYKLDELLSRVASAIRRVRMHGPGQYITKGRLVLDTFAMEGLADGKPLGLSPKEYALLLMFVINDGEVMTPEHLYEKVWMAPLNENKTALKLVVSKLRHKLAPTGCTIEAVREKGYVFLSS